MQPPPRTDRGKHCRLAHSHDSRLTSNASDKITFDSISASDHMQGLLHHRTLSREPHETTRERGAVGPHQQSPPHLHCRACGAGLGSAAATSTLEASPRLMLRGILGHGICSCAAVLIRDPEHEHLRGMAESGKTERVAMMIQLCLLDNGVRCRYVF